MKRKLLSGLAVVLLGVAIIACNKDEEPLRTNTYVEIYLHDQPVDYQQVNVEILSVILKGNGNTEEVELDDYAGVYDLLDYQNGLDTLIGEITVDFDSLKQVRLILGYENSVMVDSILHPLNTPSAHTSGYKIMVNSDLSNIDSLLISLDFDAAESVKVLGNGEYKLDPVIHLD